MKHLLTLTLLCLGLLAQAQIPSYVPTNGLVGWWPFNGNANDESGNGNHGTVNGATLAADRFGNTGKAYAFDGVDDWIDCGNNQNLQLNNFSISIWANLDSSPNWSSGVNGGGYFLQKGCDNPSPPYNGFSYRIYYQTPYGLISDNFTSNRVSLENNITGLFQNWNHIVFSYDNLKVKLFFNGIILDSMNRSGNTAVNNESLLFGCRKELINGICTLDDYFTGFLDDISIYNRSLSASEVQQLYQGGNVSSKDLTSATIHLFPNPSKGDFILQSEPQHLGHEMLIMNAMGQVVHRTTLSQSQQRISLPNIPEGIYTLMLNNQRRTTLKWVNQD